LVHKLIEKVQGSPEGISDQRNCYYHLNIEHILIPTQHVSNPEELPEKRQEEIEFSKRTSVQTSEHSLLSDEVLRC
jgi:hypothetical protein